MTVDEAMQEALDVWDDSAGPVVRTLAAEVLRLRHEKEAIDIIAKAYRERLERIGNVLALALSAKECVSSFRGLENKP